MTYCQKILFIISGINFIHISTFKSIDDTLHVENLHEIINFDLNVLICNFIFNLNFSHLTVFYYRITVSSV